MQQQKYGSTLYITLHAPPEAGTTNLRFQQQQKSRDGIMMFVHLLTYLLLFDVV